MKAISYIPDKDELIVEFRPRKLKPSKQIGRLSLWCDSEGNICAVRIKAFREEMKDFQLDFSKVKLRGIWKGFTITDKDIKESRKELLGKLEENW